MSLGRQGRTNDAGLSNLQAFRNPANAVRNSRAQKPQDYNNTSNDTNTHVIDLTSPSTQRSTPFPTISDRQISNGVQTSLQFTGTSHPGPSGTTKIIQDDRMVIDVDELDREEGTKDTTLRIGPRLVNARHRSRLYFPPQEDQEDMSTPHNQDAKVAPKTQAAFLATSKTKQTEVSPLKAITTALTNSSQGRRDVKPKAYQLEPPATGALYPTKDTGGKDAKDNRYADFFPWKGTHPEDTISEVVVRTGYFEKSQIGILAELASGRAQIVPILKQKTGLLAASALFLGVLEKRQQYNRILGNHTFKPPPRVTLTGPKREAWLKDLANPSMPLRKLSRTIPHGLRGRDLLDECSAKEIPTTRAVWFVRCVGANELRGLKRKGTGALSLGNEAKWIREWTHQVVQFLEREMLECGKAVALPTITTGKSQPTKSAIPNNWPWRERILYAIRLSTHLFSENLLDRGAFLDWYLGFLDASSLDKLPLALLLLQTEWVLLLSQRRFAERLGRILLSKSKLIQDSVDKDVFDPLQQRLSSYLTRLVLSHNEALICPQSWNMYHDVLLSCLDMSSTTIEACWKNIEARNRNLLHGKTILFNPTILDSPNVRKEIINQLDTLEPTAQLDDVSVLWFQRGISKNLLVNTFAEWAVTPSRVGHYRMYMVARVFQKWITCGMDFQATFHDFLYHFTCSKNTKRTIYLLVAELVRIKVFSPAAFMTWLISRGLLMQCATINEDQPVYIRLLAELPVFNFMPITQRNLRTNLLAQKGLSTFDEKRQRDRGKEIILLYLSDLFDSNSTVTGLDRVTDDDLDYFLGLSRSILFDLSSWIVEAVKACIAKGDPLGKSNWKDMTIEIGISALTLPQFLVIRQILEVFNDYNALAEVLAAASSSDHPGVLSSIADTLNYHNAIFSVLGCLNTISITLYERYKTLATRRNIEQKPTEPYLLSSLQKLAAITQPDDPLRQLLDTQATEEEYFLTIYFPPESDEVDEHAQGYENLLNSSDVVDVEVFTKLFDYAISHVELAFQGTEEVNRNNYSSLLSRLRKKDPSLFSTLMDAWASKIIKSTSRPTLIVAFSNLLLCGCVSLRKITAAVKDVLDSVDGDAGSIEAADHAELAFQAMEMLFDSENQRLAIKPQEEYALNLVRARYRVTEPETVLSIFKYSVQFCALASDTSLESRLRRSMVSPTVLIFLQRLVTYDFEGLTSKLLEPLSQKKSPLISLLLNIMIDSLLDEHDSNDVLEADSDVQVSRLLHNANDFSFRLCQLKMRLLFETEISNSKDAESDTIRQSITKAFVGSIVDMFKDRGTIWSDLVSVLDDECTSQIRVAAEEMFLISPTFPRTHLSFPTTTTDVDGGNRGIESLAGALLSVIESTASSGSSDTSKMSSVSLAEKIGVVLHTLSGSDADTETHEKKVDNKDNLDSQETYADIRCWIILFLRIVALRRKELSSQKTSANEQGRLLVGLFALMENIHVQNDTFVLNYIFDISAVLIDNTSEDILLQVRRFVRRKQVPPSEIAYLLGSNESLGGSDWLKGLQRNRLVDFPLKPWERLAEPTPFPGENDNCLNLALFHARKATCKTT